MLARSPRAQLLLARRLRHVRHPLPVGLYRHAAESLRSGVAQAGEWTVGKTKGVIGRRIRQLEHALTGYTPGARGSPFQFDTRDAEAIRRFHQQAEHLGGAVAEEALHGYRPGLVDRADVRLKKILRPAIRRMLKVDIDPTWTMHFGQQPQKAKLIETMRFSRWGRPEANVPRPQRLTKVRFPWR